MLKGGDPAKSKLPIEMVCVLIAAFTVDMNSFILMFGGDHLT